MAATPATSSQVFVGDIRVSFLADGFIKMRPGSEYKGETSGVWRDNPQTLDVDGFLVMSLGALLVESGEHRVLLDVGWGPSTLEISDTEGRKELVFVGGRLLESLGAYGLKPGDVDHVMFSHLHNDHVGWVGRGGHRSTDATFHNATYLVSEAEWQYWNSEPAGAVGAPSKEQLEIMASNLTLFSEGPSPIPGVDLVATPGHTPGHSSFVISSAGKRVIVLGDSVHCPLELTVAELEWLTDVDPAAARSTRERIARELEEPDTYGAGCHFADAVFGRLIAVGHKRSWRISRSIE